MKTSRWLGLGAVAAVVAAGASLNLRAQDEPAVAAEAAPLGLAAPGRVEPAGEEREIGARMPGLLVAVHVDENDLVEAGAILAEIDRSDLEAERLAALATIELRKAERARLVNGARSQERQAAKARLAAAEASLGLARKEHARIEPLAQTGVLTAADLDRALERVESATAQSAEASKQLALLQAATRSDDVKIADAQVAVAEARLEAIDAAIEKSYVRSPVAGTVLRRYRRQGETVGTQPPTVLVVVASYYVLFAAIGASHEILLLEAVVTMVFVGAAVAGFKGSPWFVMFGLASHGVMDAFHGRLVENPGVPVWWPAFCLAYDVGAAAILGWFRLRRTAPRSEELWAMDTGDIC